MVGFDINKERIEQLKSGIDITKECSSDQMKLAKKLSYSASSDDIRDAQIYIVTVPTPIDNVNRPDLSHLQMASKNFYCLLLQNLSNSNSRF